MTDIALSQAEADIYQRLNLELLDFFAAREAGLENGP